MFMNIRISKAFIEGMKFPIRIYQPSSIYMQIKKTGSIEIAWKRTGNYLVRSMEDYDKLKIEG